MGVEKGFWRDAKGKRKEKRKKGKKKKKKTEGRRDKQARRSVNWGFKVLYFKKKRTKKKYFCNLI